MNEENIINSSKAPEPVGLYPHARRVGNLLFLSGVGPRERGTKKIPGVELDETETSFLMILKRSVVPFFKMFDIFWRKPDQVGTKSLT